MDFLFPMHYNVKRKEVIYVRCDYKDGFQVDYAGTLHISKGRGVDLVIEGGILPGSVKSSLDSAVIHNSCHELRAASRVATKTIQTAFEVE
jgi:hypothetical protein